MTHEIYEFNQIANRLAMILTKEGSGSLYLAELIKGGGDGKNK